MPDGLDVVDGHRDNLAPFVPPEEEMDGPEPAAEPAEETAYCTAEQIKPFLLIPYKVEGWRYGHADIWDVSDEELTYIAERIAPDINRLPWVAKAVAIGDQKSGWVFLVYSLGRREYQSILRRREERRAAEEEAAAAHENG